MRAASLLTLFATLLLYRSGQAEDVVASQAIDGLLASQNAGDDIFIPQSELNVLIDIDGGGACPSAAAIDAVQIVRSMVGDDPFENPHKLVLSAFTDEPKLLKGRLSNRQFEELLEFYDDKYLAQHDLQVSVETAPSSPYANEGGAWDASEGPDLSAEARELFVVSYTVTEANGDVIGRHFVLLKEESDNSIAVIDPANPTKTRTYILEFKGGELGPREHVLLLNPAGVKRRTAVFELNTVFKVSIADHNGDDELSVEGVKRSIDQTVRDLRGTDDFTSPIAWRRRTARFGLSGLDLPHEHGGSGWPARKMIEIFAHAGRYNLNFRDVVGGAHVRPLLNSTDPYVLNVVKKVAHGEAYIAIAITEPTAGTDIPAIKSSSRKVDGGYLLTGSKLFNARLEQATHVILFTQGTTGGAGKLSVFLVPLDEPGLHKEQLTAHGLTGNSFGGLTFTDLFVPESRRIGPDGEGLRIFFRHFLYWRLMQSAAAIGTGLDALDQMAHRLETREAFGAPIGRFTHLQQPMGQHWTELQMAYGLAERAALLIDKGNYAEARPLICGLKAEGVEMALEAVDAATRAFGGEGYSTRVDLGDRLRDLNGLRIADGTTDVMRMEVVRKVYGEQFWEMAIENSY